MRGMLNLSSKSVCSPPWNQSGLLFADIKVRCYFLSPLSIRYPKTEPSIRVMMVMGMREKGSFQPMIIADGNKTRKEMIIPLTGLFNERFILAIKKPEMTHSEKADKSASKVRP